MAGSDGPTIHVINLDRDRERFLRFENLNPHLARVRFPAVDGRRADRDRLIAEGVVAPDLRYSGPALGNALSHIALWRQCGDAGRPITVAEDDAVFAHDFGPRSAALLCAPELAWDIVLWGFNFDAFLWVEPVPGVRARLWCSQDDLRANMAGFQRQRGVRAPVRLRHAFGIMAYTITPAGAQRLTELCLPLSSRRISFPGYDVVIENNTLDCAMNAAYPRMDAYVCLPPLAASENRHEDSTVHGQV